MSDLDLQELIDTGLAWQLEGSIGRAAMSAIEDGICTLGPAAHTDYWGNRVPAIHEVQPGTLGSLEYARELHPELHEDDEPAGAGSVFPGAEGGIPHSASARPDTLVGFAGR